MNDEQYTTENSSYGAYSRHEAIQLMDDLPQRAQMVVQDLWYNDSHQNEYDLQQNTGLSAEDITDAITILENNGLVRSRPDMASHDDRVYRLNIEDDTA